MGKLNVGEAGENLKTKDAGNGVKFHGWARLNKQKGGPLGFSPFCRPQPGGDLFSLTEQKEGY